MIKVLRHKFAPEIVFFLLFIGAAIISLNRIKYGFGGDDEAFYLSIPHRLSMGDALFKYEWHLSQMAGFLLFPLVKLFICINGGTQGIILAFRYIYLVAHGCVAIFMFIRFRKYGYFAAAGCVIFFLFTPYNIMALCYNTMTLDFLILSGTFLSTFEQKKSIYAVFAGLCFAAAVLCCPYLLAVYILYGLSLIIGKKSVSSMLASKVFLLFSVGAALLAAIFFLFIFSRMGISELLPNIKLMLTDPEHSNQSLVSKFSYYIWSLQTCHEYFSYIFMAYVVTLVVMLIDRNRDKRKMLYFIISACVTALCYALFTPMLMGLYYNGIQMPLIFTGLTAYILSKEKTVDIFYSIFVVGILYSICANFSSNTGIFTIENALSLSSFASFIFIGQFLSDEFETDIQKYISVIVAIIVVVFLSVLQYRVKTEYFFKESGRGTELLTVEMKGGPANGIITSYENAADYQAAFWDVNEFIIGHPIRENLLVLSEKTWFYLMFNDYPYATFSDWLSGENDISLDRLKDYYDVNPNKIPNYVYVPKNSQWNMDTIFSDAQKYGYEIIETDYSWQLIKENNDK